MSEEFLYEAELHATGWTRTYQNPYVAMWQKGESVLIYALYPGEPRRALFRPLSHEEALAVIRK